MTKLLESSCEARDNFLAATYRLSNTKATDLEISSIKKTIEMGVLSGKDGKIKVRDLLRIV